MYRRKFIKNGLLFVTGASAFGIITPRDLKSEIYFPPEQYPGASGPYNPYPPSGWWLLNGNGNDSSGNGANLTISGGATYVTGQNSVANSALTVGAVGGSGGPYAFVSAPACNGWTSFSCSLWFYQTGVGTGASRFFEKGSNDEITFGSYAGASNQGFFAPLGGSSFSGTFGTNVGIWYNYVFLGTAGGTQSTYQNGVLVGAVGVAGTPAATTNSIYFSTYGGSPGSFTTPGYIQDVRFWKNEVLNLSEIGLLYAAGASSVA